MVEESCTEDDKAHLEKNKKRIVKTRAQVQALEKFYNEHKYPSESMKIQLAESIGLTEKQVSGWFCHRRLKDKTGRQDRSSGVIQDYGSGHRQDSCSSTKQEDDKNSNTREVESGRLTSKEPSADDLTYEHVSQYAANYNRTDDASSINSSSLWSMPKHQHGGPVDSATSRHQIPKFPTNIKDVNTRLRPSGYLKVKGQVENAAITAVKRHLGKHYLEDGPPLGVEFDPLPRAFESSMQDPVGENYCTREAVPPASPDFSNVRQNPKFLKGPKYHQSSMGSFEYDIDCTNFKTRRVSDSYNPQKPRIKTSFSNSGAYYYPRSNSSVELSGGSAGDIPDVESRDEYGSKHRPGVEVMITDSVSSHPVRQPYREKRAESRFRKYSVIGTRVALGENIETEFCNLTTKRTNNDDKELSREIIKDGKTYLDGRIINMIPFKNDLTDPKRIKGRIS